MKAISKRFTAGLLAGLMLLIGGCSKTNGNGDTVYPGFITVTVFDTLGNYDGIQSGWFAKIVREKFNMELNIISPNLAGDGDALYLDRFAAGNLGDLIICGNADGELQDLVDAGLVVNMQPNLFGSNLMERYGDAVQNLNDTIQSNVPHAIYGIPTSISEAGALVPNDPDTPNYGTYLRYDLYKELGYPEITTLEDVLTITKKMQELCPESDSGEKVYGFSLFADWDGNLANFAKQPCALYGYDEYGFVLIKSDGTDYQNILDKDSLYYRSLHFYFEANQMGLLDPDSETQSYNDVFNKTKDGQVLFAVWPWLGQSAYNTAEHLKYGKAMMFIPITDESVYCYGSNANGSGDVIVAVGSQAQDVDRLVDFVDWLYSSEGIAIACAQRNQATAGPEGMTWEMTENGPVLTEFGITALLENGDVAVPEGWGEGTWAEGVCQLNFNPVAETELDENGYPYYYMQWDSVRNMDKSEVELEWIDRYEASTVIEYIKEHDQYAIAPAVTVKKPGETTEESTIRKQCDKIIVDYSWKMIRAKDEAEFERLFEEMRTRAYESGYETIYTYDLECAKMEGQARYEIIAAAAE